MANTFSFTTDRSYVSDDQIIDVAVDQLGEAAYFHDHARGITGKFGVMADEKVDAGLVMQLYDDGAYTNISKTEFDVFFPIDDTMKGASCDDCEVTFDLSRTQYLATPATPSNLPPLRLSSMAAVRAYITTVKAELEATGH